MHVWLRALWLVDRGYRCGCENNHWDVLRDGRFTVMGRESRISPECVRVCVAGVEWGVVGVGIQCRGCNSCWGTGGGKVVGYNCEDEKWDIIFLCKADGGRGGGESGAEGTVERGEWDAKVYGVFFSGGLDCVGLEYCVL